VKEVLFNPARFVLTFIAATINIPSSLNLTSVKSKIIAVAVGVAVGKQVGVSVGTNVGVLVGLAEGTSDGDLVGPTDGCIVGESIDDIFLIRQLNLSAT
jgi:Na+/H+ antiporter NhaA